MSKDNLKKPGFDTLVGKLKSQNSPEADAVIHSIKNSRNRALRLIDNETVVKNRESAEKKRKFIIDLAFKEGDVQKGLRESIGLSEDDLNTISKLGISLRYSGDVQFGIPFNSQYIPFILPNGQTGSLAVHMDRKKNELTYEFRKNISRRDEEIREKNVSNM